MKLLDIYICTLKKVYLVKGAEEKEEARVKFLEEAKTHAERVEKLIKIYGSNGFSVGSALTWADLAVHAVGDFFNFVDKDFLNNYPGIVGVRKSVEANEEVALWLKNRPKSEL